VFHCVAGPYRAGMCAVGIPRLMLHVFARHFRLSDLMLSVVALLAQLCVSGTPLTPRVWQTCCVYVCGREIVPARAWVLVCLSACSYALLCL
jgi:hypothetical protein